MSHDKERQPGAQRGYSNIQREYMSFTPITTLGWLVTEDRSEQQL